jgi:hypothetical protein
MRIQINILTGFSELSYSQMFVASAISADLKINIYVYVNMYVCMHYYANISSGRMSVCFIYLHVYMHICIRGKLSKSMCKVCASSVYVTEVHGCMWLKYMDVCDWSTWMYVTEVHGCMYILNPLGMITATHHIQIQIHTQIRADNDSEHIHQCHAYIHTYIYTYINDSQCIQCSQANEQLCMYAVDFVGGKIPASFPCTSV